MNKAGVWMCGCVQNNMLSPVLESCFNKVAGHAIILKRDSSTGVFL